MKMRFSEAEIIAILREAEAGTPGTSIWEAHGVSRATFYAWRAKYGVGIPIARRLKQLELENAGLKQLLVQTMLDMAALQEGSEQHGSSLSPDKRTAAPGRTP